MGEDDPRGDNPPEARGPPWGADENAGGDVSAGKRSDPDSQRPAVGPEADRSRPTAPHARASGPRPRRTLESGRRVGPARGAGPPEEYLRKDVVVLRRLV